MNTQRFASVWDAIEDTPEEAENMKLRSALMTTLKNYLTRTEMSQAEAAKLFGVTQPRISDLMRGKINLFGLDALVNMATAAGWVREGGFPLRRGGSVAHKNLPLTIRDKYRKKKLQGEFRRMRCKPLLTRVLAVFD